jgi:hypothetical protein
MPQSGLPGSTEQEALFLHVVGGTNIPTESFRLNATWPFGVLDYIGGRVTVRVRGGSWLPGKQLFAAQQDLEAVFPVRGPLASRGVGFRTPDGREWYFWSSQGELILTTLARAGFPVAFVEEKARKVWRAEP